jgi:hypothetical protein
MDTWQVTPGIDARWTLTITGEDSDPITTYLGSEALTGSIRPGRAVAPVATLAPTWKDAARGLVSVPVPGAATAGLAAGSYLVTVGLADASADVFEGILEVGYAAGTDALPPVYCSYDDLLDYADWIGKLWTPKDLTGFARQRGRARSYLDDTLVALWKGDTSAPAIGRPGLGGWLMGGGQDAGPSKWLRDMLALDALIVRDQTREITARLSTWYVCSPQLSRLDEEEVELARRCRREAEELLKTYRAEIDLPDQAGRRDGYADIVINCGATSLR